MIALYIIGGIVAYLLIGAVVAGMAIWFNKEMAKDCWITVISWPLFLTIMILTSVVMLCVRLAKRIGGVKD